MKKLSYFADRASWQHVAVPHCSPNNRETWLSYGVKLPQCTCPMRPRKKLPWRI